jgi:hypothetical protein
LNCSRKRCSRAQWQKASVRLRLGWLNDWRKKRSPAQSQKVSVGADEMSEPETPTPAAP